MPLIREDDLPVPVTGEQQYLAAILDELRGLSARLSPPAPGDGELLGYASDDVPDGETATVELLPEPPADVVADALADGVVTEAEASEAGRVLAEHKPRAKKPAAKRTTKKRASK